MRDENALKADSLHHPSSFFLPSPRFSTSVLNDKYLLLVCRRHQALFVLKEHIALVQIEFPHDALAKGTMEYDITYPIFPGHVVCAFLALCLGQAGLPQGFGCFHRIYLLFCYTGLFNVRRVPEFVHTAAGLAFYLDDGLIGHGNDRMVEVQLALGAV
jgi:hypothetical protein